MAAFVNDALLTNANDDWANNGPYVGLVGYAAGPTVESMAATV